MAKKPDIIGSIDINGRFTSGQTMPTQKITKTPALSAVSSSKIKPVTVSAPTSRVGNTLTVQPTVQPTKKETTTKVDTKPKETEAYKQSQKNLKIATNNLNLAQREYDKRLANEYQKAGVNFRPEFNRPTTISYQTKGQDKIQSVPQVDANAVQQARANAINEQQAVEGARNDWKYANYLNNVERVNNEETTNWDRLATPLRALQDLVSPVVETGSNKYIDENGNVQFLPSYYALKQQKVREDTGGLGGVAMDVGYNTTKILGAGAIDAFTGGIGGKALYWTDMAADNFQNVKNQGYNNEQAILNTIISTGSEYVTEKILGGVAKGLTGKTSGVQKIFSDIVNKQLKNPKVANIIGSMGSEGLEEFVQEFIGAFNDKITLGQDTDIVQLIKDAFYSGLVGAASAGITTGTNNIEGIVADQNVKNMQNANEYLTQQRETAKKSDVKKIDEAISETQKYIDNPFTTDYKKSSESVEGTLGNIKSDAKTIEDVNRATAEREQMRTEEVNDKVRAFRESVERENIKDDDSFTKVVEKIISDKDYNVVMDSSITNQDGKPVNALISNENGITIKINPNSERWRETLLMHEVTHGIETKEMSDLIMDYASKNSEFNTALEDLKKAYGTEDVTPEVVADISGQLFGNQEFINSLSVEKPTLFRRILDALTSLKNKLTGNTKYENFVRDLEAKWRKAYRESTIENSQKNLKEGIKYSQNAEITDNQGRPLDIKQQNFFEDSQATDDKGRLVTLYHTTTDMIKQFNEFNPAREYDGDYKFGDYNVTYLTDSKEMSGSYSQYDYRMANTKKLNSIEEAEKYLDYNSSLRIVDIKNANQAIKNHFEGNPNRYFLVSGDLTSFGEYKTEEELLRDVIPTSQWVMRGNSNFQYEVYANITKPFTIDAEGRNWDNIAREINKDYKEIVDSLSKEQKEELSKYANDSLEKYQDWLMSKEYSEYLKYDDEYKKLDNTTSENLIILSMKDNATAEDYIEMYNMFDKEGKAPDSKITVDGEEMTFAEFAAKWSNLEMENAQFAYSSSYFMSKAAKEYRTQLQQVGVDKMFEMAKYNFRDWAVEDTISQNLRTNDIVKKVIEMNKNGDDYDGVIIINTTNYGPGYVENKEAHDVYVAFNSNQIKAVDNLDPTSDPDIRYSKKAEKWQKYLEKNFKNKGTRTKSEKVGETTKGPALVEAPKAEKKTSEVAKESFKTKKETVREVKEEAPTVKSKDFKKAIEKVREGKATEKERKFVRTAVEAQNTQELVKDMKDFQKNYTPISNEDTLNKAEAQLKGMKVKEKANYVRGLFASGKRITATDMAAAELVLRDVAATKNAKLYTDTLADFGALSTEYGQVIQAISMIKKLSPTYQLDVLEKMINREVARGNNKYKDVKVTQEMRDRILNCYDDNGNLNQEQFDNTMEGIKQELADEIKVGIGEKVRAWRYLSMLGNPKTHVRNEVANLAMTAVKGIKDTVSAGAQDLFIKEENKTRTLKSSSKEVKNFASTTYNEISENISGNKYNEKTDLEDRTKVFKTRWLEAIRKFNDKALSAEDQGFKKINFKKAFANYLTAHGISTVEDIENNPQIVQQAKLFAMEEANVATFNQQNKLAEFINSGDRKLGPIYRFARGAIIPFTRTPLNIAKTGIEYTPGVGLLNTIADVQKAPKNMKGTVLIDSLSKQIVGTSLALLGYSLAKGGLVTAGTDDDKEGKFLKDQGTKMDFSIKLGDTSYDLSWLSPSSMPFFVGAKMYEVLEKQEGINENIVLESLASTLDPLSEMSCISSFTKVLNSYSQEGAGKLKDIGVSTAQNYLSQFVPTLLGQFARVFDPYKRTTSADVDAPNKITQETYRTLAYKIPGLRNMLPETTDYLGRTKKEDENAFLRAFNAMINPANTRKDTMTEEGKEILRLYEETGDDTIIPAALTQNVKYNGRDHKMTRKEYNEYKKDFGDAFEDNVKDLMKTSDYKKASDNEKADMISGIMGYAKDKTKDNFLTERGEDYEKTLKDGSKSPYESDKVDMLTNKDFSIADYYVYKAYAPSVIKGKYTDVRNRLNVINTFGIDKEVYQKYMDEIGQFSGKDRKQKIFNYINSLPLTSEQKKLLMKKQYTSYRSYDKDFFNVINQSNLTLEEKESLKNFLKIGK